MCVIQSYAMLLYVHSLTIIHSPTVCLACWHGNPEIEKKTLPMSGSLQHHIFDGYSNLVEKSVDFFRSAKVNDPRQSNQVVDTNWHRWGSNQQPSDCGAIALPTELPLTPKVTPSTVAQVDSLVDRRHCYKSRGFKSRWRSCIFSWKRFQIFQNTIDFVTGIKVGLWLRLVDKFGPQPHKSW